jgi:hypothetical protein
VRSWGPAVRPLPDSGAGWGGRPWGTGAAMSWR